jgi:acetate kinase
VLYLLREHGMSVSDVDFALNNNAGLLGLSGLSADVRELESAGARGDADSDFALDAFAYRIAKYVGAYTVVLGGLDALVFSGGIGENSADVRARVCHRLQVLGIPAPAVTNPGPGTTLISAPQTPSVWVVRTNEERQIAIETREVLLGKDRFTAPASPRPQGRSPTP